MSVCVLFGYIHIQSTFITASADFCWCFDENINNFCDTFFDKKVIIQCYFSSFL